MLEDRFGRELRGVRVSLTDRCNFDCVYCHNEGLGDTRGPGAPRDHEMTADEVVRFLEVAADEGVEAVKFTGGEPMLREDLEAIVARTPDALETSMTTNGTFLPGRAEPLADAGLERVNVSQDAMDPEAFAEVTRTGAIDAVLEGVDAALDAGLAPVKLNMVVFEATAGYVPEMVERVAANDGLRLQLIEYMPEIAGNPEWAVDVADVHDWLAERAHRVENRDMHERTRYWIASGEATDDAPEAATDEAGGDATDARTDDATEPAPDAEPGPVGADGAGAGMVEVVDPVGNADFCANCHRVRVTHDGRLKGCLNRDDDHRSMGEMTETEIRETLAETVRERVPYYGEYLVRDGDGGWERNDAYR